MADIARPANPVQITETDVYEAVRQFIAAYALPAIPISNIIQGWQNRSSLPPGTNEDAVMSILQDTQHGTTLTFLSDTLDTGNFDAKALIELHVQVDICAEGDVARQRAQRLAIITRSPIGTQFFDELGLSAWYADDVRDLSFIGDANQFVRRYMTTLHLGIHEGVTVDFEYFNRATLERIENVDVHHKPI